MSAARQSLESGYFINEGVLTSHECEQLADVLASAFFRRGRAGSRHLMSIPEVRSVASDPRMLRIARVALGTGALPYRATLFEKSGAANWLVVWHQDTALPLQSQFDLLEWGPWSRKTGILYAHAPSWALSRVVALRLHLDASATDNGARGLYRSAWWRYGNVAVTGTFVKQGTV